LKYRRSSLFEARVALVQKCADSLDEIRCGAARGEARRLGVELPAAKLGTVASLKLAPRWSGERK